MLRPLTAASFFILVWTNANAMDIGNWKVFESIEPLEKRKEVTLQNYGYRGTLVILCEGSRTSMYIDWSELVAVGLHSVKYRIGGSKAVADTFSASTDGQASFSQKPVALIKKLLTEKEFVAEVSTMYRGKRVAEFNLNGLPEAIKYVQQACAWK